MTDLDLFNLAVYWAQMRARYKRAAVEGHQRLTRRQCQLRARKAEARIVDLSIQAENRARAQASGAAA